MSYLDKNGYHTWSYSTGKVGLGGLQEVEFRVDGGTTLDEMLKCFGDYLRATGFYFDGEIDIVDYYKETTELTGEN